MNSRAHVASPSTRRNDVREHALALQNLCDQIEEKGLAQLDPQQVESIPTTLASASTALAVARSQNLQSPLVHALEFQIFRISERLRASQKTSPRTFFVHILQTVPRRLWEGWSAQLVALAFLVCGVTIGYRRVTEDPLRALSYFPDAVGGFSIGDQILSLSSAHSVRMWLQAPVSDIAFLLVSFDVHLFTFFGAFVAVALLCVGIGGLLTPLLLLSFGGALGALIGVLPQSEVADVVVRLFPMFFLLSLALMLAQSAGVQLLQASLPDRSGRPHRRAARHLQSAWTQGLFSLIHTLIAAILMMRVVSHAGTSNATSLPQILALLWGVAFFMYVLLLGAPPEKKLWRFIRAIQRRHDADPLPYSTEPPSVHAGRVRLDLREGISLHVSLARLSDRLAAALIDGMLIVVWISVCIGFILPRMFSAEQLSSGRIFAAVTLLVMPILAYNFVSEWRWQGQTVGKRIFEIRSIRLDGERMDSWTVWLRSLTQSVETFLPISLAAASYFATRQYVWWFVALALIFTVVIQLFPLLNLLRQRLGDRMTGTITIEMPDSARGFIAPTAHPDAPALPYPVILSDAQHDAIAAAVSRARCGDFSAGRIVLGDVERDTRVQHWPNQTVLARLESLYAHASRSS